MLPLHLRLKLERRPKQFQVSCNADQRLHVKKGWYSFGMDGLLVYFPLKKKATATGAVIIVDGRQHLRTYEDPLFGKFKTYKNLLGRPGFWEKDTTKIQKLIDAFKSGHNIKTSCVYAGITLRQWELFVQQYPEFRAVKEACEENTTFRTMQSFQKAIPTKPDLAFKYMERRGDFNFDTRKVDDEKPLQPTINVGVQVNNKIDNERAIEELGDTRLGIRVSERRGDMQEEGDREMAESL